VKNVSVFAVLKYVINFSMPDTGGNNQRKYVEMFIPGQTTPELSYWIEYHCTVGPIIQQLESGVHAYKICGFVVSDTVTEQELTEKVRGILEGLSWDTSDPRTSIKFL
jgi:hypothetical protein